MSTEAQRARNARKRAKLKAHRQLRAQEGGMAMYYCAIRGVKEPFPDFCRDYPRSGIGGFTCTWDWQIDYFTVSVIAAADEDYRKVKQLARAKAESVYGFSKWDCDVRILSKDVFSEN